MVSKDFTITNKMGLHMRPAQVLVSEMNKFASTVTIRFGEKKINAKGMMGLMSACIGCGAKISMVCDGTDEQAALEAAAKLIQSGFDEE